MVAMEKHISSALSIWVRPRGFHRLCPPQFISHRISMSRKKPTFRFGKIGYLPTSKIVKCNVV
uniref:Uncharacterized protein n=1 Tax=Physcomitrium patens TaxID=3218 RepID=A0A2K1K0B0_PHYPA|nr:hypothetical protein PHYPA_014331 [Physcomitrium patens]